MENSPHQPGEPGRPGQSLQLGQSDQPEQAGAPETVRMPGTVIFVLVIVTLHALGMAFGGWAILDENQSKQDHGQDLLLPWSMAWFVALFCWGLAAPQILSVVLARKRRPWVRVVLIVSLSFTAVSMALSFVVSLAAGAPSLAGFVIVGIDVAALWMICREPARHYFSVRGPAPASPRR